MSITNLIKLSIIITTLIGVGFVAHQAASAEDAGESPDYAALQRLYKIIKIVQKNYLNEMATDDLIDRAAQGMLQSLDPHSSFLNQDMLKNIQGENIGVALGTAVERSEFGGLGLEITIENGVLTIVSPLEDTPAFKAGLKPGDKIVKIDGQTTKDMSLPQAVKMLRGMKGSEATLTIMRHGFEKFRDYTLTRQIIRVMSTKKQIIEPGHILIKLVKFQEGTDSDLVNTIREAGDDSGIKGVILDLRNNPGGLLDQAVKVTNMFIDKGLLVYTKGREKDQQMEFRASSAGKRYKFKTATLINPGTAGESETVAGALQDHDRSLIFGERSSGKGTLQMTIPLGDDTGLRLTTAYYYTPKGRPIENSGIQPDVDVKEESQKQEQTPNEMGKSKTPSGMKPIVDYENDPTIRRALERLKSDITVVQFKNAAASSAADSPRPAQQREAR